MTAVPKLLVVDDDPTLVQLVGKMLVGLGEIRFATSGEAALKVADREAPDLILLDAQMDGIDGFEVCQRLKLRPEFADVPILFVTANDDEPSELRGFAVGAADFIHKPVREPLLRARVLTHLRLKALADELRHQAGTDALTHLPNRRSFDAALAVEWSRVMRHHDPLCALMVDVDRFKQYNDRYGHLDGDHCLHAVAACLRSVLNRPADLVARYGGEEFAALLPGTDLEGGCQVAERMLQAVLELRLPHLDGVNRGIVSVSVGVSCVAGIEGQGWDVASVSVSSLMERADQALYLAKAQGRARVASLSMLPVPVKPSSRDAELAGVAPQAD